MKNTGKPSEAIFEAMFAKFGKLAFVHRITDAAEVYGMNEKFVQVKKQPADYIVTLKGETFFAEIKSSSNATSFSKSQIEEGQWFAAVRQTAAHGLYFFYLHSLKTGQWFCVPARHFIDSGQSSWKWSSLEQFKISAH